jgi:cytochrome P450/nitrite reductase/ring-hydroxylating ferredoxin subunit
MEIASFKRIANVGELRGPGPFALSADGVDLAVVRTASGWRAFEGRCPHLGALLGEGELDGDHLVCRNHGWRFDVASGQRMGGPECLSSCPIVERRGQIYADVASLRKGVHEKPTLRKVSELPGPRPLPVVGNIHQLDPASAHLILERWAARYGSVYTYRMGRARAVAISEPNLIQHVLRNRPETFRRYSKMDRVLAETGLRFVFNSEGDSWRLHRKLTVAALSQRHIRQVYPHIKMVAERLVHRWRRLASEGADLDILDELKRFTVDVASLIVFDHDANTVERDDDAINKRLAVIFPTWSRRILTFLPTWRFVKLPRDRHFDRCIAEIQSWLSQSLVAARKRAAAGADDAATNFLDAMVKATDENGRGFSDDVIIWNLFGLVLAGEDTTANSAAWAVHLLTDHPEWTRRIRDEADNLLAHASTPEDFEAANALTVASAVANEAMRLRPVAPVSVMEANFDTSLGDIEIPRGTLVTVLSRPAAVSDHHFAEAEAFMPQRWLEAPTGAHDLSALIPFGSGPRMCPGRSLALIEMNTILALLYKNFEVERLGRSEDVREVYGFVMSPGGMKVRLRPRA